MKLDLLLAVASLTMMVSSQVSYAKLPSIDFLKRGFYHCDDHPTKSCTKRADICQDIKKFDECAKKCIIDRRTDEKSPRVEAKLKSCGADFISRSQYVAGKRQNKKIVDILNAAKRQSAPARIESPMQQPGMGASSDQQQPPRRHSMMGQRPPSVHEPVMPEVKEQQPPRRHSMMGQRPSSVHEPVMSPEVQEPSRPASRPGSMMGQRPSSVHEPVMPMDEQPMMQQGAPINIPEPPALSPAPVSPKPMVKHEKAQEMKQQPGDLLAEIRKGKELSPAKERKMKEKPVQADDGSGSPLEALRKHFDEKRRPAMAGEELDQEGDDDSSEWDD